MNNWHWNGYGFKAMNTRVYIWLYSSTKYSSDILLDIQSTFDSMERRLSRFIPHSELSILNHSPELEFQASPTLFSVMQVAQWAATATGGLFDPTILVDLEAAGYNCSFETMAAEQPAASVSGNLPHPGRFARVTLHPATRSIVKPRDVKIDLGGIGKGWTVDRAADRLVGPGPFLVNAGGDLYAYGAPPNEQAWTVEIPHPENTADTIATLKIADCAVATSSITRRRWRRGNTHMHHLIDPRSGSPADTDLLSVTVVARRTAIAEVFAKAALILGARDGFSFLEATPDVAGLLVTNDNRVLATSQMAEYTDMACFSEI